MQKRQLIRGVLTPVMAEPVGEPVQELKTCIRCGYVRHLPTCLRAGAGALELASYVSRTVDGKRSRPKVSLEHFVHDEYVLEFCSAASRALYEQHPKPLLRAHEVHVDAMKAEIESLMNKFRLQGFVEDFEPRVKFMF